MSWKIFGGLGRIVLKLVDVKQYEISPVSSATGVTNNSFGFELVLVASRHAVVVCGVVRLGNRRALGRCYTVVIISGAFARRIAWMTVNGLSR